jgi:plastocyanin
MHLEAVMSAVEVRGSTPQESPGIFHSSRRAQLIELLFACATLLALASPRIVSAFHASRLAPLLTIVADASEPARVIGKVTLEGTPKKLKPIDMSAEPSCAKFYDKPPVPDQAATGPDNALQNVIVYISQGAPDEKPVIGPALQLNQRGCRYNPHIVAADASQEIWVRNDDSVTHSIHPMPHANPEWNRSQPPGTPPVVLRFDHPEFIPVKCELHPWMRGVVAVFKNSHHAITDGEGRFDLSELPPGKYTITAWHELYGSQAKQITVEPGQSQSLNFVFKATPY